MLKVELEGKDIKLLQIKGKVEDIISDLASVIDEVLINLYDVTNGKIDKKEALEDIVRFLNFWWDYEDGKVDINDLK